MTVPLIVGYWYDINMVSFRYCSSPSGSGMSGDAPINLWRCHRLYLYEPFRLGKLLLREFANIRSYRSAWKAVTYLAQRHRLGGDGTVMFCGVIMCRPVLSSITAHPDFTCAHARFHFVRAFQARSWVGMCRLTYGGAIGYIYMSLSGSGKRH